MRFGSDIAAIGAQIPSVMSYSPGSVNDLEVELWKIFMNPAIPMFHTSSRASAARANGGRSGARGLTAGAAVRAG